jgi:hypothetical protein
MTRTAPVAPSASAATGPGTLKRCTVAEAGIKLTPEIMADAVVRYQAQQRNRPSAARPAARPGPRAVAAPTPPPALEDDNATAIPLPASDPVGDVIKALQDCLRQLRELNPGIVADDDGDEAAACLALAAGNKAQALRSFDAAISKLGAKIAAHRNPRTAARNKLFGKLRAQSAPLAITATDSLESRREKFAKNLFRNL